ncbi:hypothetical protein ACFE04_026281 [Oxalis oulophora]
MSSSHDPSWIILLIVEVDVLVVLSLLPPTSPPSAALEVSPPPSFAPIILGLRLHRERDEGPGSPVRLPQARGGRFYPLLQTWWSSTPTIVMPISVGLGAFAEIRGILLPVAPEVIHGSSHVRKKEEHAILNTIEHFLFENRRLQSQMFGVIVLIFRGFPSSGGAETVATMP